jgi:predicted transposase/invertase (TIGR01784 family)
MPYNKAMSVALLSPIGDLVFKRIFGTPQHADILANLLSAVLKLPKSEYEGLEFKDPHIIPDTEDGKLSILDVKLKTKAGRTIDIEIQVLYIKAMRERILYYASKLIAEQLSRKERYHKLKPVICVIISAYNLLPEEKKYHNVYKMLNTESHKLFSALLEIHTVELEKLPVSGDGTDLGNWIRFLRAEKEDEMEMIAETNEMIGRAYGVLAELSADEEFRAQVAARDKAILDYNTLMAEAKEEGWEEGKQAGWEEGKQMGREEGREEGKADIAKNMLGMGFPAEQIHSATGLSIDAIMSL